MINAQSALVLTLKNVKNLKICTEAGCYNCKKIFSVKEIKEYTDQGETALCPHCQTDAVIPDGCGIALTEKNLEDIKKYWIN